ncbi:DUF7352 domain-containing protein [Marinobacter nanhaiticus]|nr:hypothetical protein [Marinobacter nanhaiticus]
MKTTQKHLISFGQRPTELTLMPDFRVVWCEYLVGASGIYLWLEQSPIDPDHAITGHFLVARPGQSVPDDYGYVDSAVDPYGCRAHLVFQLPLEENVEPASPRYPVFSETPLGRIPKPGPLMAMPGMMNRPQTG